MNNGVAPQINGIAKYNPSIHTGIEVQYDPREWTSEGGNIVYKGNAFGGETVPFIQEEWVMKDPTHLVRIKGGSPIKSNINNDIKKLQDDNSATARFVGESVHGQQQPKGQTTGTRPQQPSPADNTPKVPRGAGSSSSNDGDNSDDHTGQKFKPNKDNEDKPSVPAADTIGSHSQTGSTATNLGTKAPNNYPARPTYDPKQLQEDGVADMLRGALAVGVGIAIKAAAVSASAGAGVALIPAATTAAGVLITVSGALKAMNIDPTEIPQRGYDAITELFQNILEKAGVNGSTYQEIQKLNNAWISGNEQLANIPDVSVLDVANNQKFKSFMAQSEWANLNSALSNIATTISAQSAEYEAITSNLYDSKAYEDHRSKYTNIINNLKGLLDNVLRGEQTKPVESQGLWGKIFGGDEAKPSADNEQPKGLWSKLSNDERQALAYIVAPQATLFNFNSNTDDDAIKNYLDQKVYYSDDFKEEFTAVQKLHQTLQDILSGNFYAKQALYKEAALASTILLRSQYPRERIASVKKQVDEISDILAKPHDDTLSYSEREQALQERQIAVFERLQNILPELMNVMNANEIQQWQDIVEEYSSTGLNSRDYRDYLDVKKDYKKQKVATDFKYKLIHKIYSKWGLKPTEEQLNFLNPYKNIGSFSPTERIEAYKKSEQPLKDKLVNFLGHVVYELENPDKSPFTSLVRPVIESFITNSSRPLWNSLRNFKPIDTSKQSLVTVDVDTMNSLDEQPPSQPIPAQQWGNSTMDQAPGLPFTPAPVYDVPSIESSQLPQTEPQLDQPQEALKPKKPIPKALKTIWNPFDRFMFVPAAVDTLNEIPAKVAVSVPELQTGNKANRGKMFWQYLNQYLEKSIKDEWVQRIKAKEEQQQQEVTILPDGKPVSGKQDDDSNTSILVTFNSLLLPKTMIVKPEDVLPPVTIQQPIAPDGVCLWTSKPEQIVDTSFFGNTTLSDPAGQEYRRQQQQRNAPQPVKEQSQPIQQSEPEPELVQQPEPAPVTAQPIKETKQPSEVEPAPAPAPVQPEEKQTAPEQQPEPTHIEPKNNVPETVEIVAEPSKLLENTKNFIQFAATEFGNSFVRTWDVTNFLAQGTGQLVGKAYDATGDMWERSAYYRLIGWAILRNEATKASDGAQEALSGLKTKAATALDELGNDIKAKANKVVENAENDTNEMLREVGDELLQGAKTVLGNTKNTIDSVVSAIDNQLGKAIGADRYIRQRARNAHLKASSNEDNISRSFRQFRDDFLGFGKLRNAWDSYREYMAYGFNSVTSFDSEAMQYASKLDVTVPKPTVSDTNGNIDNVQSLPVCDIAAKWDNSSMGYTPAMNLFIATQTQKSVETKLGTTNTDSLRQLDNVKDLVSATYNNEAPSLYTWSINNQTYSYSDYIDQLKQMQVGLVEEDGVCDVRPFVDNVVSITEQQVGNLKTELNKYVGPTVDWENERLLQFHPFGICIKQLKDLKALDQQQQQQPVQQPILNLPAVDSLESKRWPSSTASTRSNSYAETYQTTIESLLAEKKQDPVLKQLVEQQPEKDAKKESQNIPWDMGAMQLVPLKFFALSDTIQEPWMIEVTEEPKTVQTQQQQQSEPIAEKEPEITFDPANMGLVTFKSADKYLEFLDNYVPNHQSPVIPWEKLQQTQLLLPPVQYPKEPENPQLPVDILVQPQVKHTDWIDEALGNIARDMFIQNIKAETVCSIESAVRIWVNQQFQKPSADTATLAAVTTQIVPALTQVIMDVQRNLPSWIGQYDQVCNITEAVSKEISQWPYSLRKEVVQNIAEVQTLIAKPLKELIRENIMAVIAACNTCLLLTGLSMIVTKALVGNGETKFAEQGNNPYTVTITSNNNGQDDGQRKPADSDGQDDSDNEEEETTVDDEDETDTTIQGATSSSPPPPPPGGSESSTIFQGNNGPDWQPIHPWNVWNLNRYNSNDGEDSDIDIDDDDGDDDDTELTTNTGHIINRNLISLLAPTVAKPLGTPIRHTDLTLYYEIRTPSKNYDSLKYALLNFLEQGQVQPLEINKKWRETPYREDHEAAMIILNTLDVSIPRTRYSVQMGHKTYVFNHNQLLGHINKFNTSINDSEKHCIIVEYKLKANMVDTLNRAANRNANPYSEIPSDGQNFFKNGHYIYSVDALSHDFITQIIMNQNCLNVDDLKDLYQTVRDKYQQIDFDSDTRAKVGSSLTKRYNLAGRLLRTIGLNK